MSRSTADELFSTVERWLIAIGQPSLFIAFVSAYSVFSRLAGKTSRPRLAATRGGRSRGETI